MAAAETVAILRFSGRGTAEALTQRTAYLLEASATTPWRPAGDPAILFYDAPSTLPFLRRNEAAVRVDRR